MSQQQQQLPTALLTFQFPILSIFAANFPSRFAPVRYPCQISALDLP